jgi:hypothetical protein
MSRPTISVKQDAQGLAPAFLYTDTVQHQDESLGACDRPGTTVKEIHQKLLVCDAIKLCRSTSLHLSIVYSDYRSPRVPPNRRFVIGDLSCNRRCCPDRTGRKSLPQTYLHPKHTLPSFLERATTFTSSTARLHGRDLLCWTGRLPKVGSQRGSGSQLFTPTCMNAAYMV